MKIRTTALCIVACALLTHCDYRPPVDYSTLITVEETSVDLNASPRQLEATIRNQSGKTVAGISFYVEIFYVFDEPVCNTNTSERGPEPFFRGLWDKESIGPGTTGHDHWSLEDHPRAHSTGKAGVYRIRFADDSKWRGDVPSYPFDNPCE